MKQLIWDLPTRATHWALAPAILLAYALAQLAPEGSALFGLHILCGAIAGLLLAWRFIWGFVGSRHATFRSLVFSPVEVTDYFLAVLRGKGRYYAGHNPGSAVAIWMILLVIVVTLISGILMGLGGEVWAELHEVVPNLLLAVVLLHVAGVLLATLMHRENYIGSMFTGRKTAQPSEAISHSHRMATLGLVGWVAVGSLYVAGGLDLKSGVFSPPGIRVKIPLGGGEHEGGHKGHGEGGHRER